MKSNKGKAVKYAIIALHRDLGFFFAGIIIIYALSGILMNHRDSINPNYSVEISQITLDPGFPADASAVTDADAQALAAKVGQQDNLMKHYVSRGELKLLFKGGSNMVVDIKARTAVYEHISRRFLLSDMVRLHYNPGKWWSWFSDIFAVCLVIITITGLFIIAGRNGLIGRGGLLMLAGIAIPVIFLLLL